MSQYSQWIKQSVDLDKLLKQLDISNETLGEAALTQGRLYMEAARFYVTAVKETAQAKARLEERKARRAQRFRRSREKKTEGQVKELVTLSPSVQKLQKKLDESESREECGKLLLEALKMRRDAIKILSEVMDDEAHAELRIMRERRAKKELASMRNELDRKYREEEE